MTNYAGIFSPNTTPQTEQARANQEQNNAGGFTFVVDVWKRLDRFLILGAEGGSYYVGEKQLVKENAHAALEAIAADGVRVVNRIVEISTEGRAPKQDPAIFVLALAAAYGNPATKAAAYVAVEKVCRIGTHLFQFVEQLKGLRGWSRGLRTAVSRFYINRNPDQLALQVIKYRNRNGYTHRDVMRLAHPSGNLEQNQIFAYVVARDSGKEFQMPLNSMIAAFEAVQKTTDVKTAVGLIKAHRLPWEALPTQFLNEKEIWEALLPSMGITAMIRNLGKMSKLGLFTGNLLNKNTSYVVTTLQNPEEIKKSRVHPIQILIGMKTYASGRGFKGDSTWEVSAPIVDALNNAFYLAFKNVTPSGKRILIGLDVSGSMDSKINNSNLSHREAVSAMALVTAATEQTYGIMAFSDRFVQLSITPSMRLDQVLEMTKGLPFQRTDCSLPIEYAIENKLMVDVFVVYTDNETYAGKRHPFQALKEYRQKFNRNAKMVVCATEASRSTIADPSDAGMLDLVGFDSSVPAVIADFIR